MKTFRKVHPEFHLNNVRYSNDELKEVAYSFIKEGKPYEKNIGDFLLDWLDDTHCITVNTSGSTGAPKPIVLKKEYMVNSALATGRFFKIKPSHTILHCLPTDFIAGKMMLVRAMVLGCGIDCVPPLSNPLKDNGNRYDFCAMVPLQLQNSLSKINTIRTLIVGGAPISSNLKKEVQGKKTHIFETYGMTETITHIAVKGINNPSESNFEVLPNVNIITDNRGCLVIDAPWVSDTKIITNDLVKQVTDTAFKWLGRYDNIINSGGIKLIPEQIEAALSKILSNRFFLAGLPDEKLGQKLVLIVEGSVDKQDVRQQMAHVNELNKYQIPKEIYSFSIFEETKTGKIHRKKILSQLKA